MELSIYPSSKAAQKQQYILHVPGDAGRVYSPIWGIWICEALKGRVFSYFGRKLMVEFGHFDHKQGMIFAF